MNKVFLLAILLFFDGCCAMPMFDFAGKGCIDKNIFYDVKTNEIISSYKTPFSSISIWKYKMDSIHSMEKIFFDIPTSQLKIPQLKDSLAFYEFVIDINLKGDHWRMQYHLNITQEAAEKKQKIYSRFTSH